jgi:uncharacterized protein (TIGR00303 family)
MSALKMAEIPVLIVNGGSKIAPHVPFVELGGNPGMDIRTGKAVKNVEEVVDRARILGENLAETSDYLVIGESVPGGTTTALAVMLAMGVDAANKVSSSMPSNPHNLKNKIVEKSLRDAEIRPGDLHDDPIQAVTSIGDPVMPAFAGIILGAAKRIPVLAAGGTQMGAVLALVKAMDKGLLSNVAVGTTRWVIEDSSADLENVIAQISDVPILAADLDLSNSTFTGLSAYEKGFVKEGVGAGGSLIASVLRSNGQVTEEGLLREIERNYEALIVKDA